MDYFSRPDLAPCDFISFPKISSIVLGGRRLEIVETVKIEGTESIAIEIDQLYMYKSS